MNDDDLHLRWLSIAYYFYAALVGLVSCFPFIHVGIGLLFLINPPEMKGKGPPFPAELFGGLFVIVGSLIILVGWTTAFLVMLAGRSLNSRRRYYFCIVIAALCCVSVPIGTVLGVFTLLVLTRTSVRDQFLGMRYTQTPTGPNSY